MDCYEFLMIGFDLLGVLNSIFQDDRTPLFTRCIIQNLPQLISLQMTPSRYLPHYLPQLL
jgi:hypothetical protein